MNFKKQEMIDVLREEYEKRVDHYINLSEIEIKDKKDNDLISSAKGLKIKDKAGFIYTVLDVVQDAGKLFVKLLKPGEALPAIDVPTSSAPMHEDEEKQEKLTKKKKNKDLKGRLDGDVLPRNKDVDYKRSLKTNVSAKSATEVFPSQDETILVPIEEFEDNFTL